MLTVDCLECAPARKAIADLQRERGYLFIPGQAWPEINCSYCDGTGTCLTPEVRNALPVIARALAPLIRDELKRIGEPIPF